MKTMIGGSTLETGGHENVPDEDLIYKSGVSSQRAWSPLDGCPKCGAEYVHHQAPHKPLGVIMWSTPTCKCDLWPYSGASDLWSYNRADSTRSVDGRL